MISVVILTKNSAVTLERCLNALIKFPEVVIVDNGSGDNTLAIARQFANVKVYEREFCGFGPLKNQGGELASNDWLLFIDSDEVIHPRLVTTILGLNLNLNTVYQFYRQNYYDNLLIDGCSWDNDYITRLYNRTTSRFNANKVHESIQTRGLNVDKITAEQGFIYHFPYANTQQLMAKLEQYATLYALNKFGHKMVKPWTIPWRALLAFLKSYVLKKGFRLGYEGLTISCYNAMGVLVKYTKLYELSQHKNLAIAVSIDNSLAELDLALQNIAKQRYLPVRVIFLVADEVLAKQREVLAAKVKQALPISSDILGVAYQDSDLLLNNYLREHPDLDGIILYYAAESLADPLSTYLSRTALRLGQDISHGEMFSTKPQNH